MEVFQKLWQETKILARYANVNEITHTSLKNLAERLRDWYFHTGGLFLTPTSRKAYFALQDEIRDQTKEPLSKEGINKVRECASKLRNQLSISLGSRQNPSFKNS